MLASNEERLRWWGMDMRPRWRRRVAGVVSHLAFLAAIFGSALVWASAVAFAFLACHPRPALSEVEWGTCYCCLCSHPPLKPATQTAPSSPAHPAA